MSSATGGTPGSPNQQKERLFKLGAVAAVAGLLSLLSALAEVSGFTLRDLFGSWKSSEQVTLSAEARSALRARLRKLASDGSLTIDEAQGLRNYVASLKLEAEAAQRYLAEIEPPMLQAARDLQEGVDLAAQQRFREARSRFREATRLDGESALAWANFGTAALELGAITEAEAALRKALALEPESIEANYNFGACMAAQNHGGAAFDHLERALGLLLRGDARSFQRQDLLDDLQKNSHFSSLRGSPRFAALIQRIHDESP